MKPVLYDVYCGAGGATRGYQLAGFHVVGIDVASQRHYCGDEFYQMDAFEFFSACARGDFAQPNAWHCSPPCQAYSKAAKYTRKSYPDLLDATRQRLIESGIPWVIENVPGAPMRVDIRLCGCMFGLKLRRQRWFETSWKHFELRQPCLHDGPVVSVVGHGTPTWVRDRLGYCPGIAELREAMGIDWMTRAELSQAIPPAYTEYVGRRIGQNRGDKPS